MKILGIDIGKTSVKAVELDSAFGRYEIHEYYEQQIVRGSDPQQALVTLLNSLSRRPDRIITAIPTGHVTFRNLDLPTRDKKAIQSAITFELDDELPFQLEQAAFDYTVLSQGKAGTSVHVAATLKRHLVSLLESWKSIGIDPDVITTEAWAFRTLLNKILNPPQGGPGNPYAAIKDKPLLLAQIGDEKTVIYVHKNGAPILAREVTWGGAELTNAIAQKYGIPIEQAEQAKLDHGFVIPEAQKGEATAEQIEFSETLIQPLQTLIWEIRQAELSCKRISRQNVAAIFIAGGTSLLPGLGRVIEENLKVPCRPIQALSSIATSGITYSEQSDATFTTAAALALCLVGNDRNTGINLRKMEFSKKVKGREINMAILKRPLIALGAIMATFFISMGVQTFSYQSQLKEIDSKLDKSIHRFFDQLSPSSARNYLMSPSTLRTNVNKELTKLRELNKLLGPNSTSPVSFLRELSQAVPKDVVVDMTQFQVGASPSTEENTMSLTFLLSNPQMVERLSSVISSKVTGFQKSKPEEVTVQTKDGPARRVKITFTGKLTEDSYGK